MGNQLSGGQKQRIAIARIILRHPDIWIFDEATSALDSENEKLIQHAIDTITTNATSILIAHRLSTISNADKIFVMNESKIIESGSHLQLLANEKGVYRNLYDMQIFKHERRSSRMSFQTSTKKLKKSLKPIVYANGMDEKEPSYDLPYPLNRDEDTSDDSFLAEV